MTFGVLLGFNTYGENEALVWHIRYGRHTNIFTVAAMTFTHRPE
jgi:hypothetical protein